MDSRHHAELATLDESYWWFAVRYRFVAGWLQQSGALAGGGLVLDWGCGAGGFLSYLRAAHGVPTERLLGYEPAKEQHPLLRQRTIPRLEWQEGDPLADRLPSPPDVITMLDVLEHVREPEPLLARFAAAAAPGARLAILVPAFQHLWSAWDERLSHVRRYNRGDLRALLAAAGWRAVRSRYLFTAAYPAVLLRQALIGRRVLSDVEFPKVSRGVNDLLRTAFDFESRLPDLGVGTTLAMLARKDAVR